MPVDPCFSAFLADPRNAVQPPPPHVPLGKVRAVANGAMAQLEAPTLPFREDLAFALDRRSIAARHYRPSDAKSLPLILFCHGGGFVWGDLDTHDGLCRRLAADTGFAVISLDYRLAPETRFPGPVEDVFGVLRLVIQQADAYGIDPSAIALCGDSAGAAICVSVAAMAAEAGIALRHLALFYPALDPSCSTPSHHALAEGYMLTRAAMAWFWDCYLGPTPPSGPSVLPSQLADLAGLPPTSIATAEFDPLRDEGQRFCQALQDAGQDADYRCHSGMLHGFLSLPVRSPVIEAAVDHMCRRIKASMLG